MILFGVVLAEVTAGVSYVAWFRGRESARYWATVKEVVNK